MNSLLDNQEIRKRRYFGPAVSAGNSAKDLSLADKSLWTSGPKDKPLRSSSRKSPKKAAFRPAGIISLFEQNSSFMDKVRQEPVKVNRRKHFNTNKPQKQNISDKEQDTKEQDTKPEKRQRSSFALPLIPVCAIFLLALGIFFIVQTNGGMAWMDRQVVPLESSSSESRRQNMARYAGVGPLASQGVQLGSESSEDLGDIIPLDLVETFAWHTYRVRRGDSVSRIAVNFSVSMDAIIASNGITNARALREGEILRIPNMDGIPHVVREGDSLIGISQSKGVPLEAILDANDIQSDLIIPGTTLFIPGARMDRQELRLALGELFIHPVRGARLTSPFGWRNDPFTGVRRFHAAVDLAAPTGTPIVAAMEGRVSALGFNAVFGNFIIISHPGNYQTLYAHLHTVAVQRGDQVRQGATIGTVGSTGLSTGPHLHFAIYRNGRAVNPLDFLSGRR